MGHLTVTLKNGKSIYLQSDFSKASFAVDCGLVKAPDDWNGLPSNLPENWYEVDFESIKECLDEYYDIAE